MRIHDPIAEPAEAHHEYGVELIALEEVGAVDAVVWAVDHDRFRKELPVDRLKALLRQRQRPRRGGGRQGHSGGRAGGGRRPSLLVPLIAQGEVLMRKLLVTGGAGFIGANFIRHSSPNDPTGGWSTSTS